MGYKLFIRLIISIPIKVKNGSTWCLNDIPEEIKEGIEHLTGEGYVETTEPLHITGEDEVEQLHITGDHEDPGNFVNELAGDNIEDELDVVEPLHISNKNYFKK